MKRLQLRLAKWLLRRLDYQYVAIKQIPTHNTVIKHNVYTEIPTLFIEGDNELLKYVDTTGFLTKKETFGIRTRRQIFKDIIDKLNLEPYMKK